MKVPFFDISRQYDNLKNDLDREVVSVMQSTQYIEGEKTKRFEHELADYLGVNHVVTCGNGTDALRLALKACGIGYGDEVITTPFSFYATAEAVLQVGATPVFVDIEENTLNINPQLIESRITSKTKAILPVHIFGYPADMDFINSIADNNGLIVIEDACQAIGALYKNKKIGGLGKIGCFSFYPTKNLGAMGDGGALSINEESMMIAVRAYKSHGAGENGARVSGDKRTNIHLNVSGNNLYDESKYYNYLIGDNSRLDSIQAAILLVKLKELDDFTKKRRMIATRYYSELKDTQLAFPQKEEKDVFAVRHQFPVLCKEKTSFVHYLSEKGIGTGAFYPVPLHKQEVFRGTRCFNEELPVVEEICKRSVCLPVFPELKDDEVSYIINTIKSYFSDTQMGEDYSSEKITISQ